MKSWKKQLNDELGLLVPPLSEKVKKTPIRASENAEANTSKVNAKTKKRLGFYSIFATAMASLVFIFLGVFGVFGGQPSADGYVFTLEINPAVVFLTDSEGVVKSVKALNEDADVVLSDQAELNKMLDCRVQDAVVVYVDNATKLGFLDISKQENAIRISSNTDSDDKLFKGITDSAENYFRQKGVFAVVVKNSVTLTELGERIGLKNSQDIKDLQDLTDKVNALSTLYKQNVNEDATPEAVKDFYDGYVLNDFMQLVKNHLSNNVALIVESKQMLLEISDLYYQISVKSPSIIIKDYWLLAKQDQTKFDSELVELMNKMSNALNSYKTKFNKEISNVTDLQSALGFCALFSAESLENFINGFSLDEFTLNKESLVGILKNIGLDVGSFEKLLKVPQTVSEYLEQAKVVSEKLREFRLNEYGKIYEQNRAEISQKEYQSYVNDIISKYGSLDEYWNNR